MGTISSPTGDTNNNQLLDPTETWVYTASYVIPANQSQDVLNVVDVTGETPGDQTVQDTSNVTVDVGEVLGASTTTQPTPAQLPATGPQDASVDLLISALAALLAFVTVVLYDRHRHSSQA